ncbi:MAG: response regulator [Ruminococcus sp.]|nr:response regulator [Ruminococcus sp.]MCM1380874.1 response regulator [Muribaculaceae bacterium]MCM1479615.1 response regulator [Muribaculaceae bacterium]
MSAIKVLICDDSVFVRKKMRNILALLGVSNVIEAENGQQAVDKYKSETPTLVFMDIIMPEKDGLQALAEIIAFDGGARVVMASSVGTQQNLKDAIVAGAYDFLQKPIETADIARIVKKAVGS